ncbi:hypothetical protein FHR83_006635 [Actinoplanes campanulatus]|uniref:Uncharacterized protein n=1 Tax=Actinoplanes campanulatus TaxID=113559 RepID=A0A7W5AN77_9ACTN|nr:hypothetical protein [Actinoplanes campanulatus]MBB3098929.1 hypothetical protein [Actinoplanes campanulatus]GGN39810.1 hypothetical protein GCM10010109_68210 [Actinoplanes campanulatus]GID40133.1 hypothetical protein Aca09nite_66390 [Actinoplanes campanulatus]
MTGVWGYVIAFGLVAVPAAGIAAVFVLHDQIALRRGRRLVRQVLEQETARHIGDLVPEQRQSPDPVWWEFVPQQQDGDR